MQVPIENHLNYNNVKIVKTVTDRIFDWEKVTSLYNMVRAKKPNDWWVIADIDEFHLLNDTLKDLTYQIQSDYHNLKEFTENVSHEAQTPLSIISTKIELLMQETNYSERQHKLLVQTYNATQRLYKLNEGLILLTRIENKQFVETSSIDLDQAIEEKIEVLEDFIEAKQIIVEKIVNIIIIYKERV